MNITGKSLHRANIALLFSGQNFVPPENSEFMTLFSGKDAEGARFVDDSAMRVKQLILPALQWKAALEGNRFRLDDEGGQDPKESRLIAEAVRLYGGPLKRRPLDAYGFNFDIYYRFDNVLDINRAFQHFLGEKGTVRGDIRDFGIQFTLDRSKEGMFEIWFLKVTAPLELAVHLNSHFPIQTLPPKDRLQALFERCYNEADDLIQNLRFS